jgi:glycolate oxidase FAD binding subunit
MKPKTILEVQEAVRQAPQILPRGGGSKPALSTPVDKSPVLDLSALSGMVAYEPYEYTFTALAGTSIVEIERSLAEQGQYMPFDPLLAQRGATLGGTVASNTNGPGRYRYGGVRDFLLGVRYVDSQGQLISSGGKVVKNAAGFDIFKLMIGSLGQLGVVVEVTFKVFPAPEAWLSIDLQYKHLQDALENLYRLSAAQVEIDAIEIEPRSEGYGLRVRLSGVTSALSARLERLLKLLDRERVTAQEIIQGPEETRYWHQMREMAWVPQEWWLVKVPVTPAKIPTLEEALQTSQVLRRYSAGGQVAWLATQPESESLDALLSKQGLSGLALFGQPGEALLGTRSGESFYRRIKGALDPEKRFVEA